MAIFRDLQPINNRQKPSNGQRIPRYGRQSDEPNPLGATTRSGLTSGAL
jgi:hypothetical protein